MGQDGTIDIDTFNGLRILAEDDVYAVIAIRIEKAWLARNIHLLAVLAALATASAGTPVA